MRMDEILDARVQIEALETSRSSRIDEPRSLRAARAYNALQYDFPIVELDDLAALEQEIRSNPEAILSQCAPR